MESHSRSIVLHNILTLLEGLPQFSIFGFQQNKCSQTSNSDKLDCSHKKHEVTVIICTPKTGKNKAEITESFMISKHFNSCFHHKLN